jgi:hypothetical protein
MNTNCFDNKDRKRNRILRVFILIVSGCFFVTGVFGEDFKVIENPSPTVIEKKLLPLMVYKTIPEDLGNDQFLFMPGSLCVNDKFIFIYDKAQARIFKLDKALNLVKFFGRSGQGPGEFSGTGRFNPVFLKIGKDNNLYAHDYKVRKILGFSLDGKSIRTVSHKGFFFTNPYVDKNGRILLPYLRNGKVVIENAESKIIGEFTVPWEYRSYLFAPPPKSFRQSKTLTESGVKCALTADSKMLLFLSRFSTMIVVTGKKVTGKLKLWPAGALKEYKQQLIDLLSKNRTSYVWMFARIIPDQDNKDVFYLQQGSPTNNGKKGDTLFAFNLKGELLKTYFVPFDLERVIFFDKQDNIFYARHGQEAVILLKEKNHE